MRLAGAIAGLWAAACAPPVDTGSFLRLRGAVGPSVEIDGDDAAARVVWVTAVTRDLCVEVDAPPFAPTVGAYQADIEGPPTANGDPCVPVPADLGTSEPTAWGVLVLVDPDDGQSVDVTADPTTLLRWFADPSTPLGAAVRVSGGHLAASAAGFALIVHGADDAPPAPFGAAWCRFDGGLPGLTLYEDRADGCGGWVPAAPAGAHTEYQGVDLE